MRCRPHCCRYSRAKAEPWTRCCPKTSSFTGGLADNNGVIEQLIDNLNKVVATLADKRCAVLRGDRSPAAPGHRTVREPVNPIGDAIDSLETAERRRWQAYSVKRARHWPEPSIN